MFLNDYQQFALKTADHTRENRKHYYAIGLAGEVGEVLNLLKKHHFHGHPLEKIQAKLMEEIGDCLWYAVMLLHECGQKVGYKDDDDFSSVIPEGTPHFVAGAESCLRLSKFVGQISESVLFNYMDGAISSDARTLVSGLAFFAQAYGGSLEQCAIDNVAKLAARYPNGFSSDASINRKA